MASSDFSVADVLAWARTKPADEAYDYADSSNCAVTQFGRETDRPCLVDLFSYDLRAISAPLETAASTQPYTFGALVTRLEALCPDTIVTPSEWTRLDAYLTDIEMARA